MTCWRASNGFGASKLLTKDETLQRLPGLEPEGLLAAWFITMGSSTDARLLIHLAMTAAEAGGTLVNYCPATGLLRDSDGYVNGVDRAAMRKPARCSRLRRAWWSMRPEFLRIQSGVSPTLRPEPLVVTSQGIHLVFEPVVFKK